MNTATRPVRKYGGKKELINSQPDLFTIDHREDFADTSEAGTVVLNDVVTANAGLQEHQSFGSDSISDQPMDPCSGADPLEELPWVLKKEELPGLVIPWGSGWSWWAPALNSSSESQFLNEIGVVNQEAKITKCIRLDIRKGEAYLKVPETPFARVEGFSSLANLQDLFVRFDRSPLCQGVIDEELAKETRETSTGYYINGVWRSKKYVNKVETGHILN